MGVTIEGALPLVDASASSSARSKQRRKPQPVNSVGLLVRSTSCRHGIQGPALVMPGGWKAWHSTASIFQLLRSTDSQQQLACLYIGLDFVIYVVSVLNCQWLLGAETGVKLVFKPDVSWLISMANSHGRSLSSQSVLLKGAAACRVYPLSSRGQDANNNPLPT